MNKGGGVPHETALFLQSTCRIRGVDWGGQRVARKEPEEETRAVVDGFMNDVSLRLMLLLDTCIEATS